MTAIRRSARWMGLAALDLLVMALGLAIGVAVVTLIVSAT